MESEITVYGHVNKDGKMSLYNRDLFLQSIKENFESGLIELVVKKRFFPFSDKHRGFYFGVLLKHVQAGWKSYGTIKSLKQVDEELREKFLYWEEVDEETGEITKHIHTLKKSETQVTKSMMKEFVEHCIRWTAQNLEYIVPFPSEEL